MNSVRVDKRGDSQVLAAREPFRMVETVAGRRWNGLYQPAGAIRDEQLFYLASRGLSQEVAERMFVSAVLEQAAIDAPCAAARAGVLRLGEKLTPGFANLFEDE